MPKDSNDILTLLNISHDSRSVDFVERKRRFQLHSLPTEQRHPLTWNLSFLVKRDVRSGLRSILAVDGDITRCLKGWARSSAPLLRAARAVAESIRDGRRIFIYGCGSTGRLAKQMESALWRPFWRLFLNADEASRLKSAAPRDVPDLLIGEMTGGDRALVSALEGFEDLALVGAMQLRDRGISAGDAVFCITEGGETSSVIGALTEAVRQYDEYSGDPGAAAADRLFFLYNNPDDALRPFDRSREVLENPAVNRINLTTGPQAVTGSTRMQAATSETWVMGRILEEGIRSFFKGSLKDAEIEALGFGPGPGFDDLARGFEGVRRALDGVIGEMARLTTIEADVYRRGGRAVYFAVRGLIPVFVDAAERSPTFHLNPLDSVGEAERSWVQVKTGGKDSREAWRLLLGRDFRGLAGDFYEEAFRSRISDPRLRDAALSSLGRAGNDQEARFDFSLPERGFIKIHPGPGDIGVVVALDGEIDSLSDPASPFGRFLRGCRRRDAARALILIGEPDSPRAWGKFRATNRAFPNEVVIRLPWPRPGDPLGLRRQTLLKILLNAHSTAVMALLGRVVGNTMTHVSPGNLKLVGRATSLIISHVNDVLADPSWIAEQGSFPPVTYAQANAVLFRAMDWTAAKGGERSEVEMSILKILESRRRGRNVEWAACADLAEAPGLEGYLARYHPALSEETNPAFPKEGG